MLQNVCIWWNTQKRITYKTKLCRKRVKYKTKNRFELCYEVSLCGQSVCGSDKVIWLKKEWKLIEWMEIRLTKENKTKIIERLKKKVVTNFLCKKVHLNGNKCDWNAICFVCLFKMESPFKCLFEVFNTTIQVNPEYRETSVLQIGLNKM